MNPYPSRAQLRAEAVADRLLATQAASTATFQAIVLAAGTAIAALEFPLGCPADGYDLDDVTGTLADWAAQPDARRLQDRAADAFAEAAMDAHEAARDAYTFGVAA